MNEALKYCKICTHKKVDFQVGILCGLTGKKPDFTGNCPNFKLDEQESERKLHAALDTAGNVETKKGTNPRQNMIIGAIIFIIATWVTVVSFIVPLGNVVIIAYGSILYGIFRFFKGIHQKRILAEHAKFKEELNKRGSM